MARPTVDFWFEFASTYSYPAASRIEAQAERAGCQVRFRPFLLGPIFKAQGWDDSPFNLYPAKGRYMWRDLERVCDELGLPLRRPAVFPRNGLLAARVACVAEHTWLGPFVRRVYRESFGADRDIADPAVLMDCLQGLVAEPRQVLEAATHEAAKAQLRRNTEQAVELGLFGAPTCVVKDELFWGNDRIEAALKAACRGQDDPAPGGYRASPAPSGTRLRLFEPEDLPAVVSLWQTVFGYPQSRNAPERVIADYQHHGGGGLFVAIEDRPQGALVGTVLSGYDGHRGWIYRLAVAPPMRRQGLGRALADRALDHLRTLGCRKVNLQLHSDNPSARAFWRAAGFAEESRISMGRDLTVRGSTHDDAGC